MKWAVCAAMAGISCASVTAGAVVVTNEDLRHVRDMTDPRISPDGTRVLISVTEATADGGASHLWLVDARHNTLRQLTVSPDNDKAGEKEGRWLGNQTVLFLAKRNQHMRLYQLPTAGGEAKPFDLKVPPPVDTSALTEALPPREVGRPQLARDALPLEVDSFTCSPDGHTVAILARDPETSEEKSQKESKADAVWADHDPHGKRAYLLETTSETLTPVAVEPDAKGIEFDRTGARLMVIVEPPNGAGDLVPGEKAFLVNPKDPAHPQRMSELPPQIKGVAFSDDARHIYFRSQAQWDAPPGYADIYVFDLQTRQIENLTRGFTGSFDGSRMFAFGDVLIRGTQTGTQVGYVRIRHGHIERIEFGSPVVNGLDTDAARRHWVWLGQSSNSPSALFFGSHPGAGARVLVTPPLLPHHFPAYPVEHVYWNNEGLRLEGLLFRPANVTERVPLIVDVHGGPTWAWDERFAPLVDLLLAQGWAVFRPNIRGSTGYGVNFAAANKNDLGGADYRDIMSGVDQVLGTRQYDAARMALIGYSYGGEMAAFVEGKSARFRAVVSGAPVVDQYSEYGTESESFYDRWFYGKPWEHPADAWRQSPLALASKAKTPFLLIQGEADETDPLGQSLEMYRALRQAGVHVDLIKYPRETHGSLASGMYGYPSPEPWHGFDVRQRLVKFIADAFSD